MTRLRRREKAARPYICACAAWQHAQIITASRYLPPAGCAELVRVRIWCWLRAGHGAGGAGARMCCCRRIRASSPAAISTTLKIHQQVARLPGYPFTGAAGGEPGQVHPASAVLDEEQHVQAAQEHGVHVEEVHRQDRLGLGFQERPSGLAELPGCGVDARVLQDLPHRRRRDLISQAGQFAVDAPVSPAGVVPRHLQQLSSLSGGRTSGRASVLSRACDAASPRPGPQANPQVSGLWPVLEPHTV
jgi:hypothetical protein